MGASRNYQLEEFAERTGIRPAYGKRLAALLELSEEAVELIKIVEREISGIRDGDGFWGGGDPLHGCTRSIRDHYEHLIQVEKSHSLRKDVAAHAAYCK